MFLDKIITANHIYGSRLLSSFEEDVVSFLGNLIFVIMIPIEISIMAKRYFKSNIFSLSIIPEVMMPNMGISKLKDAISVAGKNCKGNMDKMYATQDIRAKASIIKKPTSENSISTPIKSEITHKIIPPKSCPNPTKFIASMHLEVLFAIK